MPVAAEGNEEVRHPVPVRPRRVEPGMIAGASRRDIREKSFWPEAAEPAVAFQGGIPTPSETSGPGRADDGSTTGRVRQWQWLGTRRGRKAGPGARRTGFALSREVAVALRSPRRPPREPGNGLGAAQSWFLPRLARARAEKPIIPDNSHYRK